MKFPGGKHCCFAIAHRASAWAPWRPVPLIGISLLPLLAALPGLVYAQVRPENTDEQLRQQQRERAQQERETARPDVHLDRPAALEPTARFPDHETPCFPIDHLTLKGEAAEPFHWALAAAAADDDSPIGRCLGVDGINLIMKRVQNAIVRRGYVTTRILASSQNLKSGVLELTLIPGRIRAIRFAPGTSDQASQWNAFPMAVGDVLNLRDIEQALENLKRLPTVTADIQIAPSETADAQPGDSDLIVRWGQAFPLRLSVSVDDAGSKATGQYQGSLTVSGDHLLSLNDLLYVTVSHDLDGRGSHGTQSRTGHYSLPFGNWLFAITATDYTYHQSVAGANQTYVYRGQSSNADVRLSRLVWRNAISKTALGGRLWERDSRNFIDDTEVQVQRRRMAGWEINLAEKLFLKDATLDLNLAYRWGTGALGALPAPEEAFGEGTSRSRLTTADLQFNQPFVLGPQKLRYTLAWRGQWNQTPLVSQERFAIGGRFTVRGFDGESLLSADRGWLLRNDLGIALGDSGAEAYLGLDAGRMGGQSSTLLIGKELAGAVFGVRGTFNGVNYDGFVGQPLTRPEGFQTARTTVGFNLNWSI